MTCICVSKLRHHWLRKWLVACSPPSQYLNQCLHIVNWTPGTNFGEICVKSNNIHCRNLSWKCHLESGGHFVSASMCYLQNILKNQLGRKLKRAFFNTSWCYIPATIASSRAESYALDKMERTHIDVFGHISWGENVFCNHLDLDVYLLFFTMLPIDMRSMAIVNRRITTA